MKRKARLTAAAALKLTASGERREVPDGRGLYLAIQESGAKSWVLRYRSPQTARHAKVTLGPVDLSASGIKEEPVIGMPLSLPAARQLASSLKREIAMGKDPAAERRQEKVAASKYTYLEAACDYAEHILRHHRQWRDKAAVLGLKPDDEQGFRPTKDGLCELWQDRAVASLTEDELFAAIDGARRRGIPGLERRVKGISDSRARAMRSALSAFFNWLKGRRKIKVNPVAGLKKQKPPAARERVLTDDEVKKFWKATEKLTPAFGKSLRLMLLTGQRRDEVAGMRRSELAKNLSLWTIPPGRTKNKREHELPLPPLSGEIIAGVESISDKLLFTITGKTPISGWSKMKPRLDKLMGDPCAPCEETGRVEAKKCDECDGKGYLLQDWTIHDLRRTAATGMARAGADLHVIERVLNHVSGSFGGIVRVYQKHKFEPEMRAALEAWENLVLAIIKGRAENVVPLRSQS